MLYAKCYGTDSQSVVASPTLSERSQCDNGQLLCYNEYEKDKTESGKRKRSDEISGRHSTQATPNHQ